MENNFDEDRVQQILGTIKGDSGSLSENNSATENLPIQSEKNFDEGRVDKIINVLRGTSENREKPNEKEEFSWPRFIGEKFTKGALNLADMPQNFVEGVKDFFDPRVPIRDGYEEDLKHRKENPYKPAVSSTVKSAVDLDTQGDGNTSTQRIAGKAAEFAGSSLIPGGGLSALAKNVGLGAVIGAETGGLEELGVPEPVAGLASIATVLAGVPAIKNAITKALNGTQNLSDAEKKVANYLQQTLGDGGVAGVNKNIAEKPNYSMTGYEPTTAEISNNPFISLLHRLRQGLPGTGLQERASSQNTAIHNTSDKLSLDASKTPHITETIAEELSTRKATRHNETNPLYEELKKDTTQIETSNVNRFFDENKIVKGKKRKDLEAARKLLEPTAKLTIAEEEALASYEAEVRSIENDPMSRANKDQLISKLNKPKANHPTVADLDEARQNINDMIGDLQKNGQNNRARQLIEIKKELDKDLSNASLQKEVTAKYAELSKPVNEILEHPTIKNIPESRLNDIFDSLFNNKSLDNMKALKQVLKDRPQDWKGIQDASVDYLMKSIKNAGAEGSRSVLSHHKLDKFIEKHGNTLKEVFTPDQVKFLEELRSALKGRNVADTLGIEKQSVTYSKLASGTHLSDGIGIKLAKGLTYIPHAIPIPKLGKATGDILRDMLGNYVKNREADVMAVVDNFLKNPEYASKLLNHKFKTQAEFNKKMDSFYKQVIPVANNKKEKEDKK